jgi:uncharacterized protein
MYYEYREPVKTIPSHRMLAIRRGKTESILYFLIEIDPLRVTGLLRSRILRAEGDWTPQLELAINDCWKRLLNPSIQGEIRLELKKRSDTDAIQVFRDNLQNLLLAAPAGPISVLGIDPGLRTGCKVAVVDETGKFLANDVLYLDTSKSAATGAADRLVTLLAKVQRASDRHRQTALPRSRPTLSFATRCASITLTAFSRSRSASPGPAFTPPPTSPARSSPTST